LGLDSKFAPPVVMVRLVAPIAQMRGARMTYIIDTKPTTTALDGLRAGESFMDPAGGVGFTVEAISATSATVKVTLPPELATGGATCLDGTPFSPPGSLMCANFSGTPSTPSDAGAPTTDAGAATDAGAGGGSGNGNGGAAGNGGAPGGGSGGTRGSGGAPGSGGRAEGAGGTSGISTGGNPGSAGTGGTASTPKAPKADGCSCDVGAPRQPPTALLALVSLAWLVRRRRR
jgi:pilus assembly protein FimV